MYLVTINVGSSSMRVALYHDEAGRLQRRAHLHEEAQPKDVASLVHKLLAEAHVEAADVTAVVHRVVHGGAQLRQTTELDDAAIEQVRGAVSLAPLHNPPALAAIEALAATLPECVKKFAAFDTALYADMPRLAQMYALPASLCETYALRRYGFHGLAHAAMRDALATRRVSAPRLITLQLGSGASATAHHDGRPVDTTMGFSPLEGLMMGTRSGDVDPGLVFHLLRQKDMSVDKLEHTLIKESGLLGVSQHSADMRRLIDTDAPQARLAVELFVYRLQKSIGALHCVLGGVDAMVFGGGIGEHCASLRSALVSKLSHWGIRLDEARNHQHLEGACALHAPDSSVQIWRVPVDEAAVMARDVSKLLSRR